MSGRDLRTIGVFTTMAFALAWLFALPLWFGDGLASPWFTVVATATMMTPAIAALVVVFFMERPQRKAWLLGLWPLRPVRRFLVYSALGIFVSIALVVVALPVGALLGVYPADFTNFSAFQQTLDEQAGTAGAAEIPLPIGALIAIQIAVLPLSALLNLIPALGEELGWRGWLLPKLMPLGTLPALLVSGVIWGLWHAPLILLGYNYPDAPGWLGLTAMVGMCVLVGAVFGWLRLRSGSVWPAALAHAAFNGAGGTYLLFAEAGEHVDTTQATILGWSGWIVPLAVVVVLIATGQFASAKHPSTPPPKTGRRLPAHPPTGQETR
ncbi:abortive phage infection protein [Saccharomonospora piscinae]|uniref:Abortive phage infection protein n=1 Tax=Saccharomonospora piscinae TaxID=687388 RepID=A0A1V9A9D1_SACPI|nr:type II CAAX endopeptidase family protein [Saccharomonospora piscinae]OQO93703.1 abortive phage infection protein [Saccharomonospora piscinae]